MHEKELKKASLEWRNEQPYSTLYGDVYFSTDAINPRQGIEETQYVFLNHNQLHERWQSLSPSSTFVIAETGFGTGLNFLSACRLWLDSIPNQARLHFISVEKHPLNRDQLLQIYALWPEFKAISDALIAQYTTLTEGFHRFNLFSGQVILTLLIGDATDMFSKLHAKVDAWFLDGFSPAKNPEMWQPALYAQMARLSSHHATFATFTSAGAVRRGLESVGFNVKKSIGYGKKREMSYGHIDKAHADSDNHQKSVIIIGAGIAGCATAYALAHRGWQVTLVERHNTIAQEASGNPRGVIYPRLASQSTTQDHLALCSYLYTLRLLTQLPLAQSEIDLCGLLQLGFNSREATKLLEIDKRRLGDDLARYVDSIEASSLAGIQLNSHALYFPQAGWVNPSAFCSALIKHSNVKLVLNTEVLNLIKQDDVWEVHSASNESLQSHAVVIANANDALRFEQSAHLPLSAVRGQMSTVEACELSTKLKTVVCTDGYLTPMQGNTHCLGATFSNTEISTEVRESDNQTNLAMIKKMSADLVGFDLEKMQGRAALRCTTPDYLPLVGELVNAHCLKQSPPKHISPPPMLPKYEGLYINVGHGSKGLTTAPFCAEILASIMSQEPLPAPMQLIQALNPNRYLLKKIGLKRLIASTTLG
jgi:tRNA 5-methylaminomethyl-2-thiouridine biosynthesis bifunctional protein